MKILFHKGVHAICWLVLTTVLCLLPGKDLPQIQIVNFDKAAHFFVFGMLCFLWIRFLHPILAQHKPLTALILWVTVFTILYGIVMEIMQGAFYTDREADVYDIVANGLGAIVAGLIVYCLPKFLK